jgi:hypothetical protein
LKRSIPTGYASCIVTNILKSPLSEKVRTPHQTPQKFLDK